MPTSPPVPPPVPPRPSIGPAPTAPHRAPGAGSDLHGPPDREVLGGHVLLGTGGRWVRALAVAVLVVLLAEALARLITAGVPAPLRWYDAATELRVQMMEEVGAADVVFAGTSMAWQGLVPAVFTEVDPQGRSAFNAGLAGAVPVVTGPWLTDHVQPRLGPQVVVWGLSSLDLAPAYGQQQHLAWSASLEGRPGVLGGLERMTSSSALVGHRQHLRRPSTAAGRAAAQAAEDRVDADRITGPGGERTLFAGDRSPRAAAVQRTRLAGFTPDPADIAAIVSTVVELTDRGVQVVLAELPVPPAMVDLHPRGAADVTRARDAIATIAEVLDIAFLPAPTGFADADFVDHTHLDAAAARRHTTAVATSMAAVLPAVLTDSGRGVGGEDEGAGSPVPPVEDDTATSLAAGVATPQPVPAGTPVAAGPTLAPSSGDPSVAPPPSGVPGPPAPGSTPSAPAPSAPGPSAPAPSGAGPGPGGPTPQPTTDPPPPASTTTTGTVATRDWVRTPAATAVAEVVRQGVIDQVTCAGGAVAADVVARAREGAAGLADRGLADAVTQLLDRAVGVPCGDEAAWRAGMVAVLDAAEDVIRAVEVVLGTSATPAGAVGEAVAASGSRDLAVFATEAHDRLEWLVDGGGNGRLSRNAVWWSYAQRGHVDIVMRTAEAGQRIDTVVVGTSQGRTGIDAARLAAGTGRSAFNAAIDGGTVDVMEVWARDFLLDAVQPTRAVVAVSGIDVLTAVGPPCPSTALGGLSSSLEVARRSFAAVPWLTGSPLRLASATDTAIAAPLRSPLRDGYDAGPAEDYRLRTPEEARTQGRSYLAAYESFTYCPDRFDALERMVGGMVARGMEVLVVTPPIHSELRSVAPAGTIENLDRQLAQITERAGGRFASYTSSMPDGEMIDLVHVSQRGAQVLTDQLIAELSRP